MRLRNPVQRCLADGGAWEVNLSRDGPERVRASRDCRAICDLVYGDGSNPLERIWATTVSAARFAPVGLKWESGA